MQVAAPRRKGQKAVCLRIGVDAGKAERREAKDKASKEKAEKKALKQAKQEGKDAEKKAQAEETKAERATMVQLITKYGKPPRNSLIMLVCCVFIR